MSPVDALDLVQLAMWTVIVMSAPAVLPAMIIGVVIALVQALTQVQEVTLTFVPKIMIVFLSSALAAHFIGNQINGFVTVIFDRIASGF
ncbi:MAG: flagellar biosynthetic protein FliQ [Rhizobiaceae bacterium]